MNTENMNDKLEPEYNLSKLKVRKIGAGRKLLQENQMTLDVDVTKVFPDSESINQSLPEAEFRPPLDFETRNFDTNNLATPPSVTENTTKHLKEKLPQE